MQKTVQLKETLHKGDIVVSFFHLTYFVQHHYLGNHITQHGNLLIHCARDTIQLLRQETPDFIGPDLWPPNSPDLNPIDSRSGE